MKPLSEKELREKIENLKHKVVMGDGTIVMVNEKLPPNKVDALVELFEQAVEEARLEGELELAEELLSWDSVLNDKYMLKRVMERVDYLEAHLSTNSRKEK